MPRCLTWAPSTKPRNGCLLLPWWPEGPGMRCQQSCQHQSWFHSVHQITNWDRRGGRAERAAGSQCWLQGVRARPSGNTTGRAPAPHGQQGARLTKHGAEKFPLPLRSGEEAATSPGTQPSLPQCQEPRWHPCTTTVELGQEEHPLAPW